MLWHCYSLETTTPPGHAWQCGTATSTPFFYATWKNTSLDPSIWVPSTVQPMGCWLCVLAMWSLPCPVIPLTFGMHTLHLVCPEQKLWLVSIWSAYFSRFWETSSQYIRNYVEKFDLLVLLWVWLCRFVCTLELDIGCWAVCNQPTWIYVYLSGFLASHSWSLRTLAALAFCQFNFRF